MVYFVEVMHSFVERISIFVNSIYKDLYTHFISTFIFSFITFILHLILRLVGI